VSKNILITGGSGLIGTQLTELLHTRGYRVAHLSRTPRSGKAQTFSWNIERQQIDLDAVRPAHAIIHLAGENVAEKRWTKERKNEIIKSRTESTRLLYDILAKGGHNVKTFISASGISYYNMKTSGAEPVDENAKRGDDFLAEVVEQWEGFADKIAALGIRVVKVRTGIALSKKGGALKEMMQPMKYYVGAPVGSGEQYVSWIHLNDVCNIFLKALEDESLQGPYNAVAPNAVTNREFMHTLAKAMDKPIILPPVPSFMLRLLFGEMADIVLKGANISSRKIQASGFEFQFEKLDDALQDLLSGK
jgi:uncharacterized protein